MGVIQKARKIRKLYGKYGTAAAAAHLRNNGYSLEAALYLLVGRK